MKGEGEGEGEGEASHILLQSVDSTFLSLTALERCSFWLHVERHNND